MHAERSENSFEKIKNKGPKIHYCTLKLYTWTGRGVGGPRHHPNCLSLDRNMVSCLVKTGSDVTSAHVQHPHHSPPPPQWPITPNFTLLCQYGALNRHFYQIVSCLLNHN